MERAIFWGIFITMMTAMTIHACKIIIPRWKEALKKPDRKE